MKLVALSMKLAWATLVLAVELLFWMLAASRELALHGLDARTSLRRLSGRAVRCPKGHLTPTEGDIYRCAGCGFVYEGGSIWQCMNPECGARTPYITCTTCGLSIRSPYRLGRP